jgi:hypothetical protein
MSARPRVQEDLNSRIDSAAAADLGYAIELWDETRSVSSVLAAAAHPAIGFAAFYAALREHPDRYITLRHLDKILTSANGPG